MNEEEKELEALRKMGVEPYAYRFEKTNISKVLQDYSEIEAGEKKEDIAVKVAGRIRSKRKHGKLIFAHIEDFTGRIQLFIGADNVSEKDYKLIEMLRTGDIVGAEGGLIKTVKGELSILVKNITLLTKSLRTLPSEWYGLKDEELRYRKRYLDILMNPDVKDMIVKKSIFWKSMRDFLISKGFLEVYTPVLENTTGGADAKPFVTHHNALDIDVFLRISCGELWQKELLVAGFEKIFEIGRIFRNEGMDPDHAQDYTQMEFYWAYADYNDNMKIVEEMYKYLAKQTFGTLKFNIRGQEVDLGKKWETYDFTEQVKKHTGMDISKASLEDCTKKMDELGIEYDKKGLNLERAIDGLWKYCRKKLVGPGFAVNLPLALSPLSKKKRDDPRFVERFLVILGGTEAGNGYSELNDPVDQAQRFKEQQKLREAGDEEAQMYDKDFVEALEYGMPPATGLGVSERLFCLLTDKPIRECTTFPLLRPDQ